MKNNERRPNRIRGGSTISQQTAKNVFLWPGRDYVRKAIEAWYTVLIEAIWGKPRIMEMYLNVIEFGPGVYGAEAASQHFFHKPASKLTAAEAARLIAVLPRPLGCWDVAVAAVRRVGRGRLARRGHCDPGRRDLLHDRLVLRRGQAQQLVHPVAVHRLLLDQQAGQLVQLVAGLGDDGDRALLGLLFVPAVVAMYLLRLRRRESVVPSTLLWQRLVLRVRRDPLAGGVLGGCVRAFARGRGIPVVTLQKRIALQLLLTIFGQFDVRQLQQLDGLLQLRRHDQRLALTYL